VIFCRPRQKQEST